MCESCGAPSLPSECCAPTGSAHRGRLAEAVIGTCEAWVITFGPGSAGPYSAHRGGGSRPCGSLIVRDGLCGPHADREDDNRAIHEAERAWLASP